MPHENSNLVKKNCFTCLPFVLFESECNCFEKTTGFDFFMCVISRLIKHIRKQINFQKRPEIQFRSTFLKIKNCPSVKMSFFYFKMIMARMSLFTGVDDHFRNQISFLQGIYKNLKKIKL